MVMTTARYIEHPAYTHVKISGYYLILGAITYFVPENDPVHDKVNVHQMTITNGSVRYNDLQS